MENKTQPEVLDAALATEQTQDVGEQNIDSHELTPVTQMEGLHGQAEAHAPVEYTQPESEQSAEQHADNLDAVLDAALAHSTTSGTVAHELDFAINRFKSDRANHKDETKYRLECLMNDASDDEKAKISAILEALK